MYTLICVILLAVIVIALLLFPNFLCCFLMVDWVFWCHCSVSHMFVISIPLNHATFYLRVIDILCTLSLATLQSLLVMWKF